MSKKPLIIFLTLLLILTSFTFAGCSGGAINTQPDQDEQQQSDAQSPDPADTADVVDVAEDKTPPTYDDDNKRVYVLDIGNMDVLLDHSGNVLLTERDLEILLDWETKEQFYVVSRRIVAKSGEDPVYSEALYALDGSLLIDYDGVSYSAASSDFVLCSEVIYSEDSYSGYYQDTERYLLNPATMQKMEMLENAGYISVIWKKYLAFNNYETYSFKILDFSGKEVFSMENASPVAMTWNDYLLLRFGGENGEHVLDKDMRVVYSCDEMYILEMPLQPLIVDGYAISSDGKVHEDYSWLDNYERAIYIDDEIAFIRYWGDEGKYINTMLNRSFDHLADGDFNYIIKLPYSAERAEKFVALEDNEIVSIGRDGKITVLNNSKTFMRLQALPDDKIMCVYIDAATAGNDTTHWWQASSGAMIIDKEGKVILDIPPDTSPGIISDIELWGAISNISGYGGYTAGPDDSFCLFVRKFKNDRWDLSPIDVYGMDTNLIVKNASAIHEVDKDRLLLTYGFSVGMMDFNGNWLYKTSAFDLMEE